MKDGEWRTRALLEIFKGNSTGKRPGVRQHPLPLMTVELAQNTAAFWVGGWVQIRRSKRRSLERGA